MSDVDNSRKRSLSSLSTDDPEVMDAIYEAWYEACDKWGELQARRKFAHVLHEPPPAQRQRVEPPPPAAQQPQPHRAAGAPAQSSGGWGSFANTEPRAEWEEFKGKLYTNNAPNVYKCLICATAGEMTGREAFVMHIEGKRHHQVVVGSGGGGGTAGYERGVPPHDPMRVLTERMHRI